MKNSKVYLFIICIIIALWVGDAKAQWISTGPYGGNIFCSTIVGKELLVGTNSGLFSSNDSGKSFAAKPGILQNNRVKHLYYDGHTVYAHVSAGGTYISRDNANSWNISNLPPNGTNKHPFRAAHGRIYIDINGKSYYTEDHGSNWNELILPDNIKSSDYPLLSNGMILFKQPNFLDTHILYRSVNKGVSWERADSGLGRSVITQMLKLGDTIYAFARIGVFTSVDSGKNWQMMTKRPFVPSDSSQFYPDIICQVGRRFYSAPYAAGIYPLLCSIESGDTQWKVDEFLDLSAATNCLFQYAGSIFISLANKKLYFKSPAASGLKLSPGSGQAEQNIFSLFSRGNTVIANLNSGYFQSEDEGNTWNNYEMNNIHFTCTEHFEQNYYAGTDDGVFRIGSGLVTAAFDNFSINCMANNGAYLYAGGSNTGKPSVLRLKAGENDWKEIRIGLPYQIISGKIVEMAILGNDLYAIVNTTGTIEGNRIYKTNISANNWDSVSGNFEQAITGITVSENAIYIALNAGQGKKRDILKSVDSGRSWQSVNNGINDLQVTKLYSAGKNVLASTTSGIFILRENSSSWFDMSYNLSGKLITDISLNENYVFIGTSENSVWKMPVASLGLTYKTQDYKHLNIYPNPAGQSVMIRHILLENGAKINIYNLSGKIIQIIDINEATTSTEISVLYLEDGLYILQIENAGKFYSGKLMVQH